MSGNPNSIWKANSELFHRIYLQEDHRLQDVKTIAERDHNFPPTPLSTYEAKLRDELKLRKNLKPEEWAAIGRHLRSRPTQCSVSLCRVRIHEDKVKRYVRRYKKRTASELPPDVSITPLSDMSKGPTPKSESYPPKSNSKPRKCSTDQVIRPLQSMPVTLATVPSSHASTDLALDIPTGIKALPPKLVGKCTNSFVDQVLMLLKSNNNSVSFVQFSAPILDKRFAKHWAPLLDNLPIVQFQRGFWASANNFSHSSFGHQIIPASDWGPNSLRSLEEIDITDAIELGLLPHSHSQVEPDFLLLSPEIAPRFECRLSTFRNPFHALSIILHHLSNKFGDSFKLKNLMDEFCQQAPESMLQMLFMINRPTIRAAWSNFLDWTVLIDSRQLFQCLGKIILQSGIFPARSTMLSKLLSFAAWFGVTDLCKSLIGQEVPLNREHNFRIMFKGSPVSMWYNPLAAAAVRGNVSTVEFLLSSGARVNAGPQDNVGYRSWTPMSPVECLLVGMRRDDKYRDNRLRVMAVLLAAGADVYSPTLSRMGYYFNDPYNLTLLDEALLSGDKGVIEVFRKHLPNDHASSLSRSGVLFAAIQGVGVLSNYLTQASVPFEEDQRRQIRADALHWAIRKEEIVAVSNMIHAGFEPDRLTERYHIADGSFPTFISNAFRDSPLTSTLRKLALFIMEHHRGADVEYALIFACLGNKEDKVWRFLFDRMLQTNRAEKAIIASLAARANNVAALRLLGEEPFNIAPNIEVHLLNNRHSVLLLSCGSFQDMDSPLRILARSRPASADTLDFLVKSGGANVASCHPRFWSEECWVEGTPLLWLLRNGLLDHGPTSIYGLLRPAMRWEGLHLPEHGEINKEIGQWLLDRSVPVLSHDEASFLNGDQEAETDLHPLSFFIATRSCPELIDRVLETGININTRGKDKSGYTPLEAAADRTDFVSLSRLIAMGAKIDSTRESQRLTALQLACKKQQCNCDICDIGDGGTDKIHWGVDRYSTKRTVEMLLKAGANPNLSDKGGSSPLRMVQEVEVMKLLLAHGACPNENTNQSITCHHRACQIAGTYWLIDEPQVSPILSSFIIRPGKGPRKIEFVQTLLEGGAKIIGDELGLACRKADLDLVKLLLDWNANPNVFSPEYGPALSKAAMQGSLPIILLLLAAGAVVDPEVDDITKSPLVAAARWGRLDAVALLMQLETRNNVIERAILEAHSEEHFEVVFQLQQLLQRRNSESTGMAV